MLRSTMVGVSVYIMVVTAMLVATVIIGDGFSSYEERIWFMNLGPKLGFMIAMIAGSLFS